MNLSFHPVLPHPVTRYSTQVHSATRKAMAMGYQLTQNEIPMFCDEGVHCIVRMLIRPDQSRTLVPFLFAFHSVKTLLKCSGRLLGGPDFVCLQAGVFGPMVIENSILNERHYSRCLEGMQLLAEAFQRLMYTYFFTEKGAEPYNWKLAILMSLMSAVKTKRINESKVPGTI